MCIGGNATKHPVIWGTVFLIAGLLFLGLAHGAVSDGAGPLASQADADRPQAEEIATRAHLGISMASLVTGVVLVLLALFCYGSGLVKATGSEPPSDG